MPGMSLSPWPYTLFNLSWLCVLWGQWQVQGLRHVHLLLPFLAILRAGTPLKSCGWREPLTIVTKSYLDFWKRNSSRPSISPHRVPLCTSFKLKFFGNVRNGSTETRSPDVAVHLLEEKELIQEPSDGHGSRVGSSSSRNACFPDCGSLQAFMQQTLATDFMNMFSTLDNMFSHMYVTGFSNTFWKL